MSIQKIPGRQIEEEAIKSLNIKKESITGEDIKDGSITYIDLAPETLINLTGLNTIATTGSFNDLVDKPTTLVGYGITDNVVTTINDSAVDGEIIVAEGTSGKIYKKSGIIIDNFGNFTNLKQSFTDVILSTNQDLPNNIWTKVRFNNQIKDIQNEFDINNFRFSPKVSGRYLFCIGIQMSYNNRGVRKFIIYKNGISIDKGNDIPDIFKTTSTYTNLNITVILDLLENDYIEIFAFQNSGQSNQYIIANNTWITISKLM